MTNRQPDGQPKMRAQFKDNLISMDGLNGNNAPALTENNAEMNLNTDASTTSVDSNTNANDIDDSEQESNE